MADRTLRVLTAIMASSVIVSLLAILAFLLIDSAASITFNGIGFLTHTTWNIGNLYGAKAQVTNGVKAPAGARYGILPFILGTVLSSVIAVALALPTALGVAILLVEHMPKRVSSILSFVVELLAGVPSVVLGLWGIIVLVPWIASDFGPWLSSSLAFVPFLSGPVGTGAGLLASSLILAMMILPIIAATTRDIMSQVPISLREAALALGMTKWEMVRAVTLPFATTGVWGAVILALGRALGETMAVLMVSGNAANTMPSNIYSPISTMASTIVAQLDSAMSDSTGMALHALAEIALVLFVISVMVNVPARILLMRRVRKETPQ